MMLQKNLLDLDDLKYAMFLSFKLNNCRKYMLGTTLPPSGS